MKHLFKTAIFIFIGLLVVSCNNDNNDPVADPFVKNVNAEQFTELEIGKDFTISNANDDIHINFEYTGKSKASKITFDVEPLNVPKVNDGEVKWQLKNHVVPTKYYAGKLNPHVHYHIHLEDANEKKITPAEGTYSFRITVEHEDKSKSYLTKTVKVVKGEKFEQNINSERFTDLEIGSSQLILPQSGSDAHVDFKYKGTSKVTKITFDIMPEHVHDLKANEFKWEVENHVVPEKHYKGQLAPHVHYHIEYKEMEANPKARPAEGEYLFKITVEHEDGTKSAITKEFQVMKKFKDVEVGENFTVAYGSDEMHVEYQYLSGKSTIAKIVHRIWFKEWRTGQKDSKGNEIKKGDWNKIDVVVDEKEFKGKKDPVIHTHFDLLPNMPKGKEYWLAIYVTETGQKEPIKTSRQFEIK